MVRRHTEHLTGSSALQNDIGKAREVFDQFLARFPLCYGYWSQYANAEASFGDKAEAVWERGVTATPYSTALWLAYIDSHQKGEGSSADSVRACVPRPPSSCMQCDTQQPCALRCTASSDIVQVVHSCSAVCQH